MTELCNSNVYDCICIQLASRLSAIYATSGLAVIGSLCFVMFMDCVPSVSLTVSGGTSTSLFVFDWLLGIVSLMSLHGFDFRRFVLHLRAILPLMTMNPSLKYLSLNLWRLMLTSIIVFTDLQYINNVS